MEMTDYENQILTENDDNLDKEMKSINPLVYIHSALISAQKTLMVMVLKNNLKEGILAYRIFIEHIETICVAAEFLSENYKKSLDTYQKTEEYVKESESVIKHAKLSNKKLELLLKEVFGKSPMSGTLDF